MYMIQICPDMYVYVSKLSKINLRVHMRVYDIQIHNCISPLTLPVDISVLVFKDTVSVKKIRVGSSSLESRSNGLMLALILYDKCDALQMLECAIKSKRRYHHPYSCTYILNLCPLL